MKQNFKRKLMAGLLSVCMIFQTVGTVPAYAVENVADSGLQTATSIVCTHHVHDEKCGYTEGTPCTHLHTEECSVAEGSTKELACKHIHDDKCGYKESKPCTFDPATCESCKAKNTVDNRATLAVGEVYAVYDGSSKKFYRATQAAPSTATTEEILSTDKTTINHLYVKATSVPSALMSGWNTTTNLKTVVCADTVKTIGDEAFYICTSLTSVVLPEATKIGKQAFYNCTSLTSVSLPEVTNIGNEAFYICTNLASVAMPKVTDIGTQAFQQCGKLASPEMPKVKTIGKSAFYGCTAFTSVSLPNATTIGISAFNGCTGLASVNMPNATGIGTRAFSGCAKLASLTLGATPPTVGTDAFLNCPKTNALIIQGNTANSGAVLAAYKAVADGDVNDSLWWGWTLPATMEVSPSAGTLAVTGNSAPTVGKENSITLTATFDKAANMGKQRALTPNQVEFKDGATPLGTATDAKNVDGKWVATLTVNTKSWTVGAHTLTAEFAGNGELGKSTTTEVTVTVNEVYAVYDGTKFCEATFDAPTKPTATVILDADKKTINHLYIMGASVPMSLMSSCATLKTVTCADTVTTIGKEAFSDCAALTSVKMPKVKTIGDSAFWSCAVLTSLTLGATPPTVVADADHFSFYGCPTSTLTIQGNPTFKDTVLAAYKAVADGDTADNLWWEWTLPTAIVATSSAGTLTATDNSNPTFGDENIITLTATFDEVAKVGKQRALAINQVEFKDGANTLETIATATQNDKGKWVATITTNTKDWTVGAHNLTAEYAGNHELGGSTTNEVTVTVNGSYAVYDGSSKKFYRATQADPTVPTATEITDKNAISHLYVKGESVPKGLMGDWQNPCPNLKTVICADTVTTIGTCAFQKCTNLTSVEMPNVTTIGKSAFYYCKSLASVAIPKVKAISESVFVNCTALASVDVSGATAIGDEAFADCTSLTSVAMPNATGIGTRAFSGCAKLTSLTLGETAPTVATNAFENCPASRNLIIQGNTANSGAVLAAYKTAAGNDGAADNLWYGWTLPATMVVSPSAGTLAVSNATTTFGKDNAITLTATFDKAANMGKQRALTINQVEFKDGATPLGTATATQNTDGKWVATLTVNTKNWALGAHKLTAEFAGNSELSNSTTNEVTVTVNESYAVYVGSDRTFYEATAGDHTKPTTTVISDSETINHLYIMGESVPGYLIGSWSASKHANLKTVICADTVTTIREYAFYNCTSLTSAKLPSVITIEKYAFNGCVSLASVEMPKVTTIGESAFMNCTELASVALPNVTTIGDSAFYQCKGFTSVELPKATSIGNLAFYKWESLASVTMPKITTIGGQAFNKCTSLASLTLGATPPTVGRDAFASSPKTNALTIQGNPDFKETVLAAYDTADGNTADELWWGWTLPATLDGTGVSTSAGKLTATGNATSDFGKDNAITLTATFDKAAKVGRQGTLTINQVEFKDGTNTLGAIATATKNADGKWVATLNVNTKDFTVGTHTLTATFAGNHELFGITTNAVTVTVNESYAVYDGTTFYRATKAAPSTATAEEITDKKTINHLYITGTSPLMYGCTNLKTVICANTVTKVDRSAFLDCTSLTSVVLSSAIDIGVGAFSGCTNLASVTMPNVTTIGNQAFYNCAKLASVDVSKVSTIGNNAFFGCTSLTSVVLSTAITIDWQAFYNCTGLASVEMPNVTSIGNHAFNGCTSLTSVVLSSAIDIGVSAFSGCTGLTSVEMSNVTTIGNSAFNGCTSLASVTMPNVTTIGNQAFYKCATLATIELPEATDIGEGAFTECTALTSVAMPNATAIGIAAFAGCTGLTSVAMPKVTSIGDSAFSGSKALTSINMPKIITIGEEAFMNCTNLASLTLSATPPTVGKNAFYKCPKTNPLTIQGNPDFKDTVLAAYKAVEDGATTDDKWWSWTLPATLDGTGVSKSEGKLSATAGSVTVNYGTDNTITFTASFAKLGENKLRTLAENQISLLKGGVVVESKPATLTGGVYSATFTVPTNAFTVGNYSYTATFDGNKSLVGSTATDTITVTINKADQAALSINGVPTVPNKVTYGDSNFTLSTTGGSGKGAVTYAVTAGSDVVSVVESTGVVTVLKAGTATITATKAADTNYNATTATTTITVNAATPIIAWANATATQTVTYTGSAALITAPTVTLANSETFNGTIQYAYKKTGLFSLFTGYTDGLPTVAGEYEIKAKIAATGNYTEAQTAKALTLTIDKATPTLAIGTSYTGKTYDGTAMANPTAKNMTIIGAAYAAVTFAYSKNSDMSSPLATAPKDAGTYYVQASVAEGDNTNPAISNIVSFTIDKVALTVADGTVTQREYNGTTDAEVTALTFNGLVNGETFALTTDYAVGTPVYNDPNAETNKTVTGTAALVSNAKTNNYTLTGAYTIIGQTISAKVLTGAKVAVGGSYTYTGSEIIPTVADVTVNDGTTTLTNGTDYDYAASNNTSAGTATVTVTFKGNYSGTAIKTFTIAKADPTYIIPTGLTAKYGQKLSELTLTTGFSWMDGTKSVGAVGAQTHKAKFTPADTANVNTIENLNLTVAVDKATPTVAVTAEKKVRLFSLGNHNDTIVLKATVTGVTGGIMPTGTVTFKSGSTTIASAVEVKNGMATYDWVKPNAAKHTITAEFVATADTNYANATGTSTAFDIDKADQAALSFDGVPTTATYGDSKITLATKGGTGTGAVTYSSGAVRVVADDGTIKGIGTATITATKAGDTNYNATTAKITIKVNAATPTIAWGNAAATQTVTYTGSAAKITAPTVTLKNSETFNGTIQYAYKKAGLFSLFTGYTDGLPTVAGEYEIKAKIVANGNYTEAQTATALTLTIEKSTPTLTIGASYTGKTYDGTVMANPTAKNMTITGAAYAAVKFAYSKNSDMSNPLATAPKNAGTYYVQASVAAGDNTNAASSTAVSFTIAQVALTGVSQEYPVVNGLAKDYSFDLSKLLPSISVTQEYGNVTYAVASTDNASSVLTASPTNSDIAKGKLTLKVANVADKDQTATVTISITSDNFTVTNAVITVKTVDKIPLTISNVTMPERVYNGSAYAYNGTPTFTNTTDDKVVTGVSFTKEYEGRNGTSYTKSATAPTNAGEYNLILTVSGSSADTHAGTLTVPFAITKKQVTIKAKDKDILVGAEIPSLATPVPDTDYTVAGFIGTDTLGGTVSMSYTGVPDNAKHGSYPITISGGTVSDNYTVKYESGTLTISIDLSPITAAITAANKAKGGIAIYDTVASSVPNGTKFVTTAEMTTLNTAIQTATDAKASCTTLTQVQATVKALDDAVADFRAAIKTGTYTAPSGGDNNGGSTGSTGSTDSTGATAPAVTPIISEPNADGTTVATFDDITTSTSVVGEATVAVAEITLDETVADAATATTPVEIKATLSATDASSTINSATTKAVDFAFTVSDSIAANEYVYLKDIKVSSDILAAAATAGKDLTFSVKSASGTPLFSMSFKGSELKGKNLTDVNLALNVVEPSAAITKALPFASVLSFENNGAFPAPCTVTVNVTDMYKDGTVLNLYYDNVKKGTLDLVKQGITVAFGEAEATIDHASDYILSTALINTTKNPSTNPATGVASTGVALLGQLF